MVASISTWRLAATPTLSRNSRTFSCWRDVARTDTTPVSGLTITEAASRKVSKDSWVSDCPVLVAGGARTSPTELPCDALVSPSAVVVVLLPRGTVSSCLFCTVLSTLPFGKTLSVSRRRSLMFFSSVSQKRFLDTFVMESVELLLPLAPLAPPIDPEITCVAMPTVSFTSRVMFT